MSRINWTVFVVAFTLALAACGDLATGPVEPTEPRLAATTDAMLSMRGDGGEGTIRTDDGSACRAVGDQVSEDRAEAQIGAQPDLLQAEACRESGTLLRLRDEEHATQSGEAGLRGFDGGPPVILPLPPRSRYILVER